MNVFKRIGKALQFWKWGWLRSLLTWGYKEIIIPSVKQLSQEAIKFIIESIKAQAMNNNVDGYTKIKNINKSFRKKFSSETIANDALNSIITSTYSALKQKGELYK